MATPVLTFYAVGDCMAPWRRPGELVLCHRTRQPVEGINHVLVVLRDEDDDGSSLSLLGVLVKRAEGKVVVRQYNPDRVISLEEDQIEHVYRVIEWQEAIGIA
jgi:phage repressor protein C with HTH and peptisase S24 domain